MAIPIEIRLSWHEVMTAAMVGVMRQVYSLRDNRKDRHGFKGCGWNEHIEGACAEQVLSKFLNVYWSSHVNHFEGDDLPGLQVRTRMTPRKDFALIVRPSDSDQGVFVHVTGVCPTFYVHGWIRGSEAKKKEYYTSFDSREPAYFVPNDRLNPIESLKDAYCKQGQVMEAPF